MKRGAKLDYFRCGFLAEAESLEMVELVYVKLEYFCMYLNPINLDLHIE